MTREENLPLPLPHTSVLPTEILIGILQFACDDSRPNPFIDDVSKKDQDVFEKLEGDQCGYRSPITLGSVCHLWRNIVHATPTLWSATHVNLNLSPKGRASQLSLLALVLKKSAGVSLSLSLDLRQSWETAKIVADPHIAELNTTSTSLLVHPDIDQELIINLPRVRELRLIAPPIAWKKVFEEHQLPQLEFLCIYKGDVERDLELNHSVNLRHLHIYDLRFRSLQISLPTGPNLTHITLRSMWAHTALKLLFQCPNLIEFNAKSLYPESEVVEFGFNPRTSNEGRVPYTLEKLKLFGWDMRYGWDRWHESIAQHLNMPHLETMIWYCGDIHPLPNASSIKNFLSRLPASLKSLHLRTRASVATFHDEFISVLPNMPGLEEISLDPCTEGELYRTLRHIVQPPGNESPANFFPRLRKMTLFRPLSELMFNAERGFYASEIIELLEKRLLNRDFELALDVIKPPESGFVWSDETNARLQRVRPGFDLSIAGQRVSWLV